MTAPMKPWEVTGVNSCTLPATPGVQNVTDSSRLQSSAPVPTVQTIPSGTPLNVRRVRTVPAPPPRPHRPILGQNYIPNATQYSPYASYGNYGTSYGGYSGFGGYGNTYGGYASYGSYGMNRFGYNLTGNDPESRFIQLVEESSRPAFQSIESLVHAFGSVSFMLESTFNAVYSSFRAVLGVAENFGRLRTMFGQFYSTFAVLRILQWLYKKLLYLIGLRQENPMREAVWQQVVAGAAELPAGRDSKDSRSSWLILVFMGIMFSGPYLVWKLISSLNTFQSVNPYNPREWKESKDVSYPAVAIYDFMAASEKELSFNAGQTMMLAPKELQPKDVRGWLLATVDGSRVGYVPYNYIRVLPATGQVAGHSTRSIPVPVENARVDSYQAPAAAAQMETLSVPCPDHTQDVLAPSMQAAWAPPGDQPTPVVILNPTDICSSHKAT